MKLTIGHQCLLVFLGCASVKAARKTLVKSTPELSNRINWDTSFLFIKDLSCQNFEQRQNEFYDLIDVLQVWACNNKLLFTSEGKET